MRTNQLKSLLVGLVTVGATACSDKPAPSLPVYEDGGPGVDAGPGGGDGSSPDREPLPFHVPRAEEPTATIPPFTASFGDGGVSDGPDAGPLPEDTDGDRIADVHEGTGDFDNDGTPDYLDLDSDNDGLLDIEEAGDADVRTPPVDTDSDGAADFRDLDSDNDTLTDTFEGLRDPDGDGRPAFVDLDADDDGIPDLIEGTWDTDSDETPDFVDSDSDGDGISDEIETDDDFDGDTTGNWRDDDSDGDGLLDSLELIRDPDGDGQPAFIDLDSDNDGLTDAFEQTADPDGDGLGAWVDMDTDGDTIADADELLQDPDNDNVPAYLDLDSDNDGLPDRVEGTADPDGDGDGAWVDEDADGDTIADADELDQHRDDDNVPAFLDLDTDGDGIPDAVEAGDADLATEPVDSDGDGQDDYVDQDSDRDFISDAQEGASDFDGDGLPDYLDPNSDNDDWSDREETDDSDLTTPAPDTDGDGAEDFRDIDSDNDGFGDSAEDGCPLSTNHRAADSDGDGLLDPIEVAVNTLPCDASSVVEGLFFMLPALGPVQTATLPFDETDIDRADLVLNVDTTGTMGGEMNELRTSLSSLIIPGLQAAVAEAGFAVTSFEDYPVPPFGASDPVMGANELGDRPFRLLTRVTTDVTVAQNAVGLLTTRNGQDLPEAGLESLYQIARGTGTSWGDPSYSVPAFNNAVGLTPQAYGQIGGVGFRDDSLPIIVHVTDAVSHFASAYHGVSTDITAVPTATVRQALADIGARVITVVSEPLPRPVAPSQTDLLFADSCQRVSAQFFGRIDSPRQSDVDWYRLQGATAGQTVVAEVTASRLGSTLDSVVAVYNGANTQLGRNDNLQQGVADSRLQVILSGPGPYYVAVSSFADYDFNTSDAETTGYYLLDVTINGAGWTVANPTCPGQDGGHTSSTATTLQSLSSVAVGPPQCEAACSAEIADEPLALPYGITQSTGAIIPPCAWDVFGVRPAACSVGQCCTGPSGLGQDPNAAGMCPLSFEVRDNGAGLGDAIVTGLEALVSFSTFELAAVVRRDERTFDDAGIDTRCFIHGVVPHSATVPNACAPTPVAGANGWTNVVPGTELVFRIDARNQAGNSAPCVPQQHQPVAFKAFIDVVADGITVVDTATVTIVVPGQPTATGN